MPILLLSLAAAAASAEDSADGPEMLTVDGTQIPALTMESATRIRQEMAEQQAEMLRQIRRGFDDIGYEKRLMAIPGSDGMARAQRLALPDPGKFVPAGSGWLDNLTRPRNWAEEYGQAFQSGLDALLNATGLRADLNKRAAQDQAGAAHPETSPAVSDADARNR